MRIREESDDNKVVHEESDDDEVVRKESDDDEVVRKESDQRISNNLDKIQKSLELKAEEAKLITTLNLLKETKNLVHLSANKEWLVRIKQGTETDKKGSEDYQYCVNVIIFDDVRWYAKYLTIWGSTRRIWWWWGSTQRIWW